MTFPANIPLSILCGWVHNSPRPASPDPDPEPEPDPDPDPVAPECPPCPCPLGPNDPGGGGRRIEESPSGSVRGVGSDGPDGFGGGSMRPSSPPRDEGVVGKGDKRGEGMR